MKRSWFKPIVFIPPATKFSFVSHYRWTLIETAIVAVVTAVLLSTLGLNFGVDFRGGTMIEMRTSQVPADVGAIRKKLGTIGLGGIQVQQFGAQNEILVRMEEQPGGDNAQQAAVGKVQAALGEGFELRRVEVVGATVSAELVMSAIIALTLALLGIFAYLWFRFEWQFSVSAVVALLHDMAMVLCLFSILQLEVDLTIIAALLTLIGYAVNDTVVTFDRVRENLRKYKRMPHDELIDLSVNETLSRTAMTAGAVLITLIALFALGGPVIHGFALAMLFGSIVSSYTSMFVAAPLLYVIGLKRDWGAGAAAR
jgi:preprotein translocase subunit SecF